MDEEKGFCGVSLIELAIHYRRGRLLVADLAEFFAEALAENIALNNKRAVEDCGNGLANVQRS